MKGDLVDSVVISDMIFSTNELKEFFSASENDVIKMKNLATYYCHLQMKGESSFSFLPSLRKTMMISSHNLKVIPLHLSRLMESLILQ